MSHAMRFVVDGELVAGVALDFEPLREAWNEYRCEDGSLVRLRTIVSRIVKLERLNELGEPMFQVQTQVVVAALPRAVETPAPA